MYIGVGGAITYASDPEAEFEEMLLKSKALLRPFTSILEMTSFQLDL